MARPVTLFTGQWADLPLELLAGKLEEWGFDGAELACWGDHFEVDRAIAEPHYVKAQRDLLERHGLGCWAIGAHLVGQCVADPIDARHKGILPPEIWGDGDPEGVRQRAAERMKDTARAAAAFGVPVVNGFTGSPVWHMLYSFPPNDFDAIERGYQEFAERWGPIIDVFDAEGVKFALEVHPTEIAYDFVTTRKTLDAIGNRPGFGINLDPSHFAHQFLDTAAFAIEFADRIYHVHVKDSRRTPRRAELDPRRSPQLRRAAARLGLRLARPRRRRLRDVLPGAQPDRLHGAALDRVGGLRHGSRVGGTGLARVRAPHRLRAVRCRVRRGDAAGRLDGRVTGSACQPGSDARPRRGAAAVRRQRGALDLARAAGPRRRCNAPSLLRPHRTGSRPPCSARAACGAARRSRSSSTGPDSRRSHVRRRRWSSQRPGRRGGRPVGCGRSPRRPGNGARCNRHPRGCGRRRLRALHRDARAGRRRRCAPRLSALLARGRPVLGPDPPAVAASGRA